jgi:hypothetical protein
VTAAPAVQQQAVRERPLLFSAPMVRAILEGRKTQTRRLIEPQPPEWIDKFGYTAFTPPGHISGRGYWKGVPGDEGPAEKFFRCPHGAAGDRLWVRETWRCGNTGVGKMDSVHYRADADESPAPGQWKPSIFMPRWASRITLEVTGVRVERLSDISEEDARAEGVELNPKAMYMGAATMAPRRFEFAKLWDSINGKRAAWASNPWLWVIAFRRVS